nr:MAG TPA: hypothetical protein [Caudoviricetes sp.]
MCKYTNIAQHICKIAQQNKMICNTYFDRNTDNQKF